MTAAEAQLMAEALATIAAQRPGAAYASRRGVCVGTGPGGKRRPVMFRRVTQRDRPPVIQVEFYPSWGPRSIQTVPQAVYPLSGRSAETAARLIGR